MIRISALADRRALLHARRLWLHYGVFWLGAVAVGLVAVFYAKLIDFGYAVFLGYVAEHAWLPLIVTPLIGAVTVWLTRRFFDGAEGAAFHR